MSGPLLRFRRLQCLVGLWGEGIGGLGYQGSRLLEALRRDEEADSPFRPRLMALVSKEQATALLAEAKAESYRVHKEQRRERTARWREFCQDQATEGAGRLFKWVRTGTAVFGLPSCPPSYEAEEGCPAPGQQSRIAAVDKAWWKFWGTEDAGAEDFGDWVGPLRELPRHPPPSLGSPGFCCIRLSRSGRIVRRPVPMAGDRRSSSSGRLGCSPFWWSFTRLSRVANRGRRRWTCRWWLCWLRGAPRTRRTEGPSCCCLLSTGCGPRSGPLACVGG